MLGTFALVLFVTPGALDEDPGYQQAVALYRELELEQALIRFQDLALRSSHDDAERAELFLWIGLCYAGAGKMDAARRSFHDALRLVPDAALPEPEVSPVVKAMVDEVRAEVRAELAAKQAAAAEPPAPPAPPEAPPDEAASSSPPPDVEASAGEGDLSGGFPWLATGGGAIVGTGFVVVLGGAALSAASYLVFLQAAQIAADPNGRAVDAVGMATLANGLLLAGGVTAAGSLVVLAAGGAVLVLGLVLE